MAIKFKVKGHYKHTLSFLKKMEQLNIDQLLSSFGKRGVDVLQRNTPKDTGLTADSWSYNITKKKDQIILSWDNSNFSQGIPVAILIQYGHATLKGSFVRGIDYINPAMKPVFDKMLEEIDLFINS